MKLALEIPVSMLPDIIPLTDMSFTLTHMVLQNDTYREFYEHHNRHHGDCILDNSMHELNHQPMTPEDILEAASAIRPTYIIPPDTLGDSKYTWEAYKRFTKQAHGRYHLMPAIQGKDYIERRDLFRQYCNVGAAAIALPYRSPRLDTFRQLLHEVGTVRRAWPGNGRIHLLGMNTITELIEFRNIFVDLDWPRDFLSLDTAKPIKWGLQDRLLENLQDTHGGGLVPPDVANWTSHDAAVYRNIAYLRKFL